MTSTILISAPLASSIHMVLTMSMLEYSATPNVAANSPIPETMIDGIEVDSAVTTEPLLSDPPIRSALYRVVIRIA